MEKELERGLKAAVLAYTLWGLLTIYWKQLSGLDAIEMIGWRIATAGVVMAAIVTVTARWPDVIDAFRDRGVAGRLVVASVLLTLNWTTYVWAVVNGRVIETALGYFLAPLGTMALGVIVLGERMTRLRQISATAAVVAVAVLTVSYGRMPWVALILAGSWSWYGLTKRRVPLDAISSLSSELFVLMVPALFLIGLGWFRSDGIPNQASGGDWVLLLGTGVITAVPLTLFAFAAQRVPFTLLGPANYLVPLINFLLGWLAFGESLPASRIVGFGLVWVALALVTVDLFRSRTPVVALHPTPTR